jgi:hypothetical protein
MTDKATPAKKAAPKKAAAKKTAAPKKTASTRATEPSAAEDAEPEPAPAPERFHSDDPKEMFRHALEQKKRKSGFGSEAHLSGGTTTTGKSGKAGGKREFRRKSG